jgi:hypothetical protein
MTLGPGEVTSPSSDSTAAGAAHRGFFALRLALATPGVFPGAGGGGQAGAGLVGRHLSRSTFMTSEYWAARFSLNPSTFSPMASVTQESQACSAVMRRRIGAGEEIGLAGVDLAGHGLALIGLRVRQSRRMKARRSKFSRFISEAR